MTATKSARGSTLIEVVIAAGLAALGLGAVAVGVSTVVLSGTLDVNAAQANAAARSIEASLMEKRYAAYPGAAYAFPPGDVSLPAGYVPTLAVENYDPGTGQYCVPGGGCPNAGLQLLTVTVTPPHGGVTARVSFLKADRPTT